jgi:hypothetical protein
LLEGVIAVSSGLVAGSIALVGFGVDSFIESLSGAVLLWRLYLDDLERRERAEAVALRIVGVSFLSLAAYVGFDAIKSFIYREPRRTSNSPSVSTPTFRIKVSDAGLPPKI